MASNSIAGTFSCCVQADIRALTGNPQSPFNTLRGVARCRFTGIMAFPDQRFHCIEKRFN